MSENAERYAKDLIEDVMTDAVGVSVAQMNRDNKNRVSDNDDDGDDENDDTEKKRSSEITLQQAPQNTQESNTNINEILQQVAQLAESLRDNIRNIQIGDYVVSMNVSPLEIQVKQTISSLQMSEDILPDNLIITKGEGDGEHQELATDDEKHGQISVNKCNSNDSPSARTSSSAPNAISTVNAADLQREIEQLTGSLKRKKYVTLGERIRRIFRFSFSRRKNS